MNITLIELNKNSSFVFKEYENDECERQICEEKRAKLNYKPHS